MLEGVGLGLAGPSFVTAYFQPGGNPRSPPARIRRSRRVQLRWSGLSHPWVKLLLVGLSHRSGRLEHDALGNDALSDIAPQGDEQFAGQRDDGDPADPSLRGADPRPKPAAQRRVRLVTQPKPGKLDHGLAQAAIVLTSRCPDPVRRRRSARGWAPIPHMPPPGGGCRSCETTIPANRSEANSGPKPL